MKAVEEIAYSVVEDVGADGCARRKGHDFIVSKVFSISIVGFVVIIFSYSVCCIGNIAV